MMRKLSALLAGLLMFAPYMVSQRADTFLDAKSSVSVPDSEAAIKIAKRAMKISDPAPKAKLENGTWTVTGRACCHDKSKHLICEPGRCFGGGERVVIRQSDGKVLSAEGFK